MDYNQFLREIVKDTRGESFPGGSVLASATKPPKVPKNTTDKILENLHWRCNSCFANNSHVLTCEYCGTAWGSK